MAKPYSDNGVAGVESTSQGNDHAVVVPTSDITPDGISSNLEGPSHGRNQTETLELEESQVESKENKTKPEVVPVEETAPPPYTPATGEAVQRPFWKKRWFLLASIAALILLIVVIATSLGVALSKKHSGNSTSPSTNASNPSQTGSASPTSSPHSGNASPPLRNTAIAAVSVSEITSSEETPLVQVFFQDSDYYLCSKTSTSGVETWPLSNSGTRLVPAQNNTPISVVHAPEAQVPIRVFFINPDGYLADVYQPTWGGAWLNGSLADRQFQVQQQSGDSYNSISAGWCSHATVYALGTDLKIYAFQASDEDADGNVGAWSVVWHSEKFPVSTAVNIAALCLLSIDPAPPVLFMNQFDGIESTGHLMSVINGTNATIPFPPDVASRYRPNSPIAAVYGSFEPVPAESPASNNSMFLFFPLPRDVNTFSPNPSLHMLSAEPYWDASVPPVDLSKDSFSLNWTSTQLDDTGVVPFANGPSVLFGDLADEGDMYGSVDNNVAVSMPRAWAPLLVYESSGKRDARVVVVYQDEKGGIQVSDVIGGGNGNYPIIPAIS